MPWPGISLRLALLLWAASVGPPGLNAEQNIGCLFSERLCLEEEWCYDDYAFGRCLPSAGSLENSDYYRFDLEREELHELKRELERLFTLGYRWNHGYTQCRLQAMLYAIKHRIINEPDSCSHLVDQDLEGALKAMDIQVPIDPEQVAIIRYTPSDDDPRSEFADEVYYPPERNRNRNLIRDTILSPNAIDIMDMEDPSVNNRGNDYELTNTWSKRWIPQMHRRSLPYDYQPFDETNALDRLEYLSRNQQDHSNDREMYNPANNDKEDNSLNIEDLEDIYSVIDFMNKWQLRPTDLVKILTPESYERLKLKLEELEANLEANEELSNSVQTFLDEIINNEDTNPSNQRFAFPYNTPDNFRSGWEARDTVNRFNDLPEPRIYYDEMENPVEENGSGYQTSTDDIYRKLEMVEKPTERNRPVEGGIFRELQQKKLEEGAVEKRFGQGVYTEGGMVYPSPNKDAKRRGFINEDNLILPSMMKKGPRSPIPNKNDIDFSDQEPDHVFVAFDRNFRTWKHGQDVIKNLSTLLQMDATDFDNGRVLGNVISFKVLPNSRGYNATEVARKISLRKKEIHLLTGLQVREVGTDREKVNAVFAAPLANNSDFYMMIFMVCGILGAIIISVALLILMRRHIKAREKLHGLSRPDTEASKDYQDLCRARMSKGQQPPGDNARITSLSKESEQSPSSRSSTSSWSEEPALHNMDISTGHMVLSYMEDHLKNKDRLDHEWEALCAYVAEPCATTIANLPDNKEKNRHPEVVPYDHARVLLNTLCNASGCDYINASSVTDHDPRHPAYLATQGPLPNTAADFWQLVWEQGAVVIVMLTRLTESGHAMCHRYWPEEGSELYHTYEVHLVSEHIWCDDYLVRSFYLKNTRTGETRTVTQFHFLSWSETGVPVSTKALLEFRRKVNKSYRGRSCPIVVHCSDGAGRTGTYCLIDMVLSRMAKGAKEIDIAATLEHLRDQRPGMVSSKQQFEFVLTAVAEEVHAILKALPAQPNPVPEKEK